MQNLQGEGGPGRWLPPDGEAFIIQCKDQSAHAHHPLWWGCGSRTAASLHFSLDIPLRDEKRIISQSIVVPHHHQGGLIRAKHPICNAVSASFTAGTRLNLS